MSDISHLVNGNKNREGRVDKVDADRFNSIVERISGVNPSKLAAEAAGKPAASGGVTEAAPTPPSVAGYGAGPAHDLSRNRPDMRVEALANKVAYLENKLAKYEVFNGDDNDVVVAGRSKGPRNRGPESSLYARSEDENNTDTDPAFTDSSNPAKEVEGLKKLGRSSNKKGTEAQMAGEHVNILGMSMTEWREMIGVKTPVVALNDSPQISESYEDEFEDASDNDSEYSEGDEDMTENQLWADYLSTFGSTPEEFAAFVEEADAAGDEEALIAIQELEDEFVEHLEIYLEVKNPSQSPEFQWLPPAQRNRLMANYHRDLAAVAKMKKDQEKYPGMQPHEIAAAKKREQEAQTQAALSANADVAPMSVRDQMAIQRGQQPKVGGGDSTVGLGHRIPPSMANKKFKKASRPGGGRGGIESSVESIDTLWANWLEERNMSVEGFAALVESASTYEEVYALNKLQAMFESEKGFTFGSEHSVVDPETRAAVEKVSRRDRGIVSGQIRVAEPKMAQRPSTLATDNEAFECDADEDGNPDMSHPGWRKMLMKSMKAAGAHPNEIRKAGRHSKDKHNWHVKDRKPRKKLKKSMGRR